VKMNANVEKEGGERAVVSLKLQSHPAKKLV
jgi:hypothetical protein